MLIKKTRTTFNIAEQEKTGERRLARGLFKGRQRRLLAAFLSQW